MKLYYVGLLLISINLTCSDKKDPFIAKQVSRQDIQKLNTLSDENQSRCNDRNHSSEILDETNCLHDKNSCCGLLYNYWCTNDKK